MNKKLKKSLLYVLIASTIASTGCSTTTIQESSSEQTLTNESQIVENVVENAEPSASNIEEFSEENKAKLRVLLPKLDFYITNKLAIIEKTKPAVKAIYDNTLESLPEELKSTPQWIFYGTSASIFRPLVLGEDGTSLEEFDIELQDAIYSRVVEGAGSEEAKATYRKLMDVDFESMTGTRSDFEIAFKGTEYEKEMRRFCTSIQFLMEESYSNARLQKSQRGSFALLYVDTYIQESYLYEVACTLKDISNKVNMEFMSDTSYETLVSKANETKPRLEEWNTYKNKITDEYWEKADLLIAERYSKISDMVIKLQEIANKAFMCTDNDSLAQVSEWAKEYLPQSELDEFNQYILKSSADNENFFNEFKQILYIDLQPDVNMLVREIISGIQIVQSDPFELEPIRFDSEWERQGDGGYSQGVHKPLGRFYHREKILDAEGFPDKKHMEKIEQMGLDLQIPELKLLELRLPKTLNSAITPTE